MNTLDNLVRANQVPVDFTLDHLRMLRQGQQADQMNLADLARRQQHEASMDPLRLRQAQATIGNTEASTAQTMEQAWRMGRDNAVRRSIPMEQEVNTQLTELLRKASDNDLELTLNEARGMAVSGDPQKRKIGEMLLGQTEAALKERRAHAYRMQEIGAQGANALRVATTPRPAPAVRPPVTNDPKSLYTYYMRMANDAEDPAQAQQLRQLADEQWQKAMELAQAQAAARQAGQPMVPGLPTQPMPQPSNVGPDPRRAPAQAPSDTVRVRNPNGQVGTIPRSQLDAAKAQGYSEVK